ncbi:hypothetical protein WOA01_23780 [Methylocystis sp. IM2]|uniref:hypothetical protein n=1 Tax=Methylocystis sp. IM2 TaxID=3136563 RepID=UPI0030F4C9CF
MTAARLAKLEKILALHEDPAATEGQRQACRHVGGRLAADLGIEFSREAIERASYYHCASSSSCNVDFDIDASMREWMAMSQSQRQREMDEIEKTVAAWRECEVDRARACEVESTRRDEERARKKAQRAAERAERKAESERRKRVIGGEAPPQWDDIDADHLDWLSRIEALCLCDEDIELVRLIRSSVRNGCLGLFGDSQNPR